MSLNIKFIQIAVTIILNFLLVSHRVSQYMNDSFNIIGLLSSIRKTVYLHNSGTVLNLCGKFLFMHRIQTSDKTILLACGVKDFKAQENENIIFVSGLIQQQETSQEQGSVQAENVTDSLKTQTQTTYESVDQKYGNKQYQCFQFDLIGEFVYNYHTFPDAKVHCYNDHITAIYCSIPLLLVESPVVEQSQWLIQVSDAIKQTEFTINNVEGNVTAMRNDNTHLYIIFDETKLTRYSFESKSIENLTDIIVPGARIQDIMFRDDNIFILQKREELTVITCANKDQPECNIVQRTIYSAQLVSYGEKLCYKLISGHFAIVELTNKLKVDHMHSSDNGIGVFYCMNRLRGSKANSIYASDFV